jgi:phenylalanyl-tRNA synthetase beta chain
MNLPEAVLELDLTPNYATHCQSVIGVAREVAAQTGVGPGGLRYPGPPARLRPAGEPASAAARVTIEAPDLCPRYMARIIRGVSVGPSPWWLQLRVLAAGMRPINNIVDITNYVMLEYGQPLHAFDLSRVTGRHIIVRRARPGESILTLDGETRELAADMLVIADEAGAVAVAGVMGGGESEVTPGTVDILLESAHFDAHSVRRTSKALGLTSEASGRFDKGADPLAVDPASLRATQLIAELAGGTAAPGEVDANPRPFAPREIILRSEKVSGLLGTALNPADVSTYLGRLGLTSQPAVGGDGLLAVVVPSWRSDIYGEADLIEEVARLYGYNRIPATLPRGATTVGTRSRRKRLSDRARQALVGLGFAEVLGSSLVDPDRDGVLSPVSLRPLVLANPLSENRSAMRTGLLGSLVEALAHNQSHGERSLRLFELGPVYWPREGELSPANLPDEKHYLAAVAVGKGAEDTWPVTGREPDFFYAKGLASVLLWNLGVTGWTLRPSRDRRLHPGRQATLLAGGPNGDVELGVIGELHPRVLRDYDVDDRVMAVELDFGAVVRIAEAEVRFEPLPRYPAVARDVAVVLGDDVKAGRIEEVIRRSAGDLCVGVRLFDVYRGHPVPEHQRSTAWRVVYRARDRSLTDAEVDDAHGRVREALKSELGAVLR